MLLPRPLSICEADAASGILRVVYRVVGGGTENIANAKFGDFLRIIGPLGNGYTIDNNVLSFAIVGGGLGVPPLLELSKRVRRAVPNAKIAVFLGFRNKSQIILADDFEKYADSVAICTDDGSHGFHGTVLAAMQLRSVFDMAFGCGPKPMLRALARYSAQSETPCYVSLEEHMACCIGTCLACAVKVQDGDEYVNKRACYDGPVFGAKEVAWE